MYEPSLHVEGKGEDGWAPLKSESVNIPSPNIALKYTVTTNMKSRNVTLMCRRLRFVLQFLRWQILFIYAHAFMSDVQMGVNKGRWEGTRNWNICLSSNFVRQMMIHKLIVAKKQKKAMI